MFSRSSKPRRIAIAAAGVAALSAVAFSCAATANAKTAPGAIVHSHVAVHAPIHPDGTRCYTQNADYDNNAVWSTYSQDDTTHASYGADDFTLTSKCVLKKVIAYGQYFGGVTADSETVVIYKDYHGGPNFGAIKVNSTVVGADNQGTFTLTIPKTTLKPGTYWIAVYANMPDTSQGPWYWDVTADQTGSGALWENPGDGFGTGCTFWANLDSCLGITSPDLMFALKGA